MNREELHESIEKNAVLTFSRSGGAGHKNKRKLQIQNYTQRKIVFQHSHRRKIKRKSGNRSNS